jgi:hypothetical protein
VDVAAGAQHAQALGAHGGEVRAARQEGHVRPDLGQRRAEGPADAAGADHCDAHGVVPCPVHFARAKASVDFARRSIGGDAMSRNAGLPDGALRPHS